MSQMHSLPTIKPSSLRAKKNRTLLDALEKNFSKYSEAWTAWYPGLSLPYLKNHFYDYCGKPFSYDDFFGQWFGGQLESVWVDYKEKLDRGVPLAYIIKKAYFFESEFIVDNRVLIPRFETEVLLEQIFNEMKSLDKTTPCRAIRVAEVGVGPGTISLSLAQRKYAHPLHISAGDISIDALKVCELNTFQLGFSIPRENKVDLILSDRMKEFSGIFDMIYSNPPYIKKKSDFDDVHVQVSTHEPEMALFLEDDEYERWFDHFFKEVGQYLAVGGLFLMEGHENHLELLLEKIKMTFSCDGEVIKDLTGRNRILKIRKNHG